MITSHSTHTLHQAPFLTNPQNPTSIASFKKSPLGKVLGPTSPSRPAGCSPFFSEDAPLRQK